jgi:aryl-alcohol dehydrogenase-like predicted oxidoreductase
LSGLHDLWRARSGNHAWTLPEESSRPIIKRAIEGGINFFDTANSYSDGSSEEIVGRALRDFARRDDIVVATKVYYPVGDLPQGLSRAQILRSIDDSLRRLNMDYVDLLQIHRWDYNTPIEETLKRSTTSSKPVKHAISAHRRCTRRSLLRRWICRRSTAGRALSPCRITTI